MYQFIHFESYALSPSKRSKSLSSIVNEMMRKPCAIPHIERPKKPKVLYGVDAYTAESIVRSNASIAKDKLGRKLRKDAQVALAGVVSLPIEFVSRYGGEKTKQWIHANIKYLKDKYQENLLSVVLHTDESHPHLHFIISIPKTNEPGKANLAHIHEPFYARQFTEGGKKNKFLAYKREYRKLQDDYYNKVSSKFSLVRLGPKNQRLTSSQYKAQKHSAELLSKQKDSLLKSKQKNKAKENELVAKQRKLDDFRINLDIIDEIDSLRIKNDEHLFEKIKISSTIDSYLAKLVVEKALNKNLTEDISDLKLSLKQALHKNIKYELIINKIQKGDIKFKNQIRSKEIVYEK